MLYSMCRHYDDEGDATQPSIARVCRQIHNEALPIFYGQNTFFAHIHRADFTYLFDFMETIGEANRKHTRKVVLQMQDLWACGEGAEDFIRWLARCRGVDKLEIEIDVNTWIGNHTRLLTSQEMSAWGDGEKPRVELMWNVMTEAIVLARELAESGQTREARFRERYEEWMTDHNFWCPSERDSCSSGHPHDGYCMAGSDRQVYSFRELDTEREPNKRYWSSRQADGGL